MKTCPRCNEMYDGFPALSRLDNRTEICSACGTDEAMQDYLGKPLTVFPLVEPETTEQFKEELAKKLEEHVLNKEKLNVQSLIDAGFDDDDIEVMCKSFMVTHKALEATHEAFKEQKPEGFPLDDEQLDSALDLSKELAEKVRKYLMRELPQEFNSWVNLIQQED